MKLLFLSLSTHHLDKPGWLGGVFVSKSSLLDSDSWLRIKLAAQSEQSNSLQNEACGTVRLRLIKSLLPTENAISDLVWRLWLITSQNALSDCVWRSWLIPSQNASTSFKGLLDSIIFLRKFTTGWKIKILVNRAFNSITSYNWGDGGVKLNDHSLNVPRALYELGQYPASSLSYHYSNAF